MSKKKKKEVDTSGSLPEPQTTPNPDMDGVKTDKPKENVNMSNNNQNGRGGGNKSNNSNSGLNRALDQYDPKSRNPKIQSYVVNNLSTGLISRKFYNQNVIQQTFREVMDNTITMEYCIAPDSTRLEHQANVWASKIISTQDMVLRDYLSNSRSFEWQEILEHAYVYSYYKAVLYAFTDEKVSELPDTHLVAGHALLYNILSNPGYTFEKNGMFIRYTVRCTKDEYAAILEQVNGIDYLRNYLYNDTRFSFEIPLFDRVLNKLSFHTKEKDPQFCSFSDPKISTYVSIDNFPLGNSCYSLRSNNKINTNKWFYCHSEKFTVLEGNTLFGKAVFLAARNQVEVSKYYEVNNKDDSLYLVKYEVASLAGSSYPNPKVIKTK